MRALVQERLHAIQLRKKGKSYRDILNEITVSKSTLSAWLQDLPLTTPEKEVLKRRKDANISRGRIRAAAALRSNRLDREASVYKEARETYARFAKDPFFLAGIALYWAEGSKRHATCFSFINSDPDMIAIIIKWLKVYLFCYPDKIRTRLYIHKPYASENCEAFWQRKTHIPLKNFRMTIYKPTSSLVKKRPSYKGCLRIEYGNRPTLLKMLFWQSMLIEQYLKG